LFHSSHPYILTYVDSFDTEDSVLLVTEPCTPLEIWLKKVVDDPTVGKQNLFSELTWGFKCILKALEFLHSNCNLIHGNLGLHSIFITPNGDWKLGSLELACNVTSADDLSLFLPNHFILDSSYISPERQKLKDNDQSKVGEVLKARVPPYYIDMYSFGQCVTKAFILCKEEMQGSLEKYILLTLNPDIKKRPQAKKLLTTSIFNSDYIKILESIQEFSLKNPKEVLEAIGQLDPLLPQMANSICGHKLLPSVNKVLQISINDFQNRDAREGARQVMFVYYFFYSLTFCDSFYLVDCHLH
jgi:SCY1-like protein 1